MQASTEKLQKILANSGLGSRRAMEDYIQQGRITIDDRVAKLGDRVGSQEIIKLDGKIIKRVAAIMLTKVLLYNKPLGEHCTRSDPEGRKTVFQNLPELSEGRWISIGRLDAGTSGLLLFTNNGELANLLMHPSSEIEREYAVKVPIKLDPKIINVFKTGITLEDGLALFKNIYYDGPGKDRGHWYRVILCEGRNREVRRMFASQGIRVLRLARARYGNMTLSKLVKAGEYRYLTTQQISGLKSCVQNHTL